MIPRGGYGSNDLDVLEGLLTVPCSSLDPIDRDIMVHNRVWPAVQEHADAVADLEHETTRADEAESEKESMSSDVEAYADLLEACKAWQKRIAVNVGNITDDERESADDALVSSIAACIKAL